MFGMSPCSMGLGTVMAFVQPVTLARSQPSLRLDRPNRCVVYASAEPLTGARSRSSAFDMDAFSALLSSTQSHMCESIEAMDGGTQSFGSDPWESNSGNGVTRGRRFFFVPSHSLTEAFVTCINTVLQGGTLFEKAGVNVSRVTGILSQARADTMASRGRVVVPGEPYSAAALSFVLHSQSPFIPTLRGDVRVFAAGGRVWGGGGADLTVFYVDRTAFARFHRHWRDVCAAFDRTLYPRFKRWCDEYFYLPARAEHRGVGGIFYDDLEMDGGRLLNFQKSVVENFLPSFQHIVEAKRDVSWTEEQKKWQRIRRGRYIEFNLLNDRGVRFGLAGAPPSRTDSIMISAPPSVEWPYGYVPKEGSAEADTVHLLSGEPVDWVDVDVDTVG